MQIALAKEMETLLIPLYGRARMSQKGIFPDADSEQAIRRIDYDFAKLKIQEKTQVMLSLRSALIDDFTQQYLRENPECPVVYLGCGLDPRAVRLGYPAKRWYDLDYPEVIGIKRQLWPETAAYWQIPSSVTDWDWMQAVQTGGSPVLVIAEGLLMYLNEADVRTLFLKMRDVFDNAMFVFDAFSHLTAKHSGSHPSLKKTGAAICWGVDSPEEIETFGKGVRHIQTLYLTDEGAISRLPKSSQVTYRLAGKFKVAREAHRIFIFALSGD